MVSRKFSASLITSSFFATLAAQLFLVLPAQAACTLEGKQYETGETAGPYVCMPDGTWQQQ